MKTTVATIALISGFAFCSASAAETHVPKVYLTADNGTPFESVVKILEAFKAAGVENLPALITSTAEVKNLPTQTIPAAQVKNLGITLVLDKDTSLTSVMNILDACKAAGLKTVSVNTTTTGETTK